MEILSIGEKIKRARIYKGYTLKDICEEEVSVSKMSCIENGKTKPEEWILDHVAQKLDIDINYLKQDVRDQLNYNLKNLCANLKQEEREEVLKYNLEFAEEYKYYDIGFEFMHMLFNYYLDINDTDSCQLNTSRYYNICRQSQKNEDTLTYYLDIGKYLFISKEYFQASNYYNNVKKILSSGEISNHEMLARASFNEAACYIMLKDYRKAYEIVLKIIDIVDYISDDLKKAEVYNIIGVLSIALDNSKFKDYEKKSYELCKDNLKLKARFIYNYGYAMIERGNTHEAVEYLEESIECYPTYDEKGLAAFLLTNVETLIKINELDKALNICDKALNYAINVEQNTFIEKAYYFKGLITGKKGNLYDSEMYMNLALDVLLKIGRKQQIYKRYMEMGSMYTKMNNVSDALKYFSLAMIISKKM